MPNSERKLVAIAAPTCAGKTTLLNELAQRIGKDLTAYNYDEHDLFPSGSPQFAELMRNGGVKHWEDPRLFGNYDYICNLRRLQRGQPAQLQPKSRESMARRDRVRLVYPSNLLVAEGIFAFYYWDARQILNTTFYIDLPEGEMVRRRLERTPKNSTDPWDQEEYIKGPMVTATRRYVIRQKTLADVQLNGMDTTDSLANQVMDKLGIK